MENTEILEFDDEEREAFIQEALLCEGAPWVHEGRGPNDVGYDCAGLPIVAAQKTGLYNEGMDMVRYSRRADGYSLLKHLNKFFIRKDKNKGLKRGDVLILAYNENPSHVAIFLGKYKNQEGDYIIHALLPRVKKVVIQRMDSVMFNDVKAVFAFKTKK